MQFVLAEHFSPCFPPRRSLSRGSRRSEAITKWWLSHGNCASAQTGPNASRETRDDQDPSALAGRYVYKVARPSEPEQRQQPKDRDAHHAQDAPCVPLRERVTSEHTRSPLTLLGYWNAMQIASGLNRPNDMPRNATASLAVAARSTAVGTGAGAAVLKSVVIYELTGCDWPPGLLSCCAVLWDGAVDAFTVMHAKRGIIVEAGICVHSALCTAG